MQALDTLLNIFLVVPQVVWWRSIKTSPPSRTTAVTLWMLESSIRAVATLSTMVPSIIISVVHPALPGKLRDSVMQWDALLLHPFINSMLLFCSQIWLSHQEASHSRYRQRFAPQPRLCAPQLQDLFQTRSRWEWPVADLCLQHRWEHHGGPPGSEDLLCHILHKHHLPPHQSRQRLYCLWSPVCHRHQRHQSHLRFRPVEGEAGQRDLWPEVSRWSAGNAILQPKGQTPVCVGPQLRQALCGPLHLWWVKMQMTCRHVGWTPTIHCISGY